MASSSGFPMGGIRYECPETIPSVPFGRGLVVLQGQPPSVFLSLLSRFNLMSDVQHMLGRFLTHQEFENAQRDAIHIAVLPVLLTDNEHDNLTPGTPIVFRDEDTTKYVRAAKPEETPIGIIDPFLKSPVENWTRFFMFLYPNTVTGMRHHWSHPAIDNQLDEQKTLVEAIARKAGVTYERMMGAADHWQQYEDYLNMGENEDYKDINEEAWKSFWAAYKRIRGVDNLPKGDEYGFFTCSC